MGSSLPKQSADATRRYEAVPGKRIHLAAMETTATGVYAGKADARADLKRLRKQIDEFVRRLGAEKRRAVLVVLQGVDAAGKDGTVRHVFTGVNPELCHITAFEEPNAEELRHDYLWRVHRAMPETGMLGVFNRSHYEDVLVPRARGQLSAKDTRIRLRQIADAERMWSENGTTLLKFLLHISRKEQTKRFHARLDDPEKHWKVKESDLKDRKLWRSFQHAYEDAIFRTTRRNAPWYIVPSDHKWFRDVVIAGVLVDTLRRIDPRYPRNSVKK